MRLFFDDNLTFVSISGTFVTNLAHVKGRRLRGYPRAAERVRRPRAGRYGPLPGGFGHQLAGTTTGPGGAFPGLGLAGAGNARVSWA